MVGYCRILNLRTFIPLRQPHIHGEVTRSSGNRSVIILVEVATLSSGYPPHCRLQWLYLALQWLCLYLGSYQHKLHNHDPNHIQKNIHTASLFGFPVALLNCLSLPLLLSL